jgi:hypothetical protein
MSIDFVFMKIFLKSMHMGDVQDSVDAILVSS